MNNQKQKGNHSPLSWRGGGGEAADKLYMRRCIQLALNGRQNARPNPMVGAVIVHEGRIIGEGYHVRCGEGHAEVNAFASVKPEDECKLPESTIYVSLEPCAHYGKTPPCADLIIRKGVRRVVVGCVDPFAKVRGKGISKIREAGITVPVVAGIMPITNASQVSRAIKLSGSFMPQRFKSLVDKFGSDPLAMKQAGIAYATEQIIDLFANGVNAVHVYSMNKPEVAAEIRRNLSEIIEKKDSENDKN